MSVEYVSHKWTILLPLIMMCLDICVGFLSAWVKGEVKTRKMREGFVKKAGEIIMLFAIFVTSQAFSIPPIAMSTMSVYLAFTEFASVVETLEKTGIPMPSFVKSMFKNLKK